jgi:hypothetical protein
MRAIPCGGAIIWKQSTLRTTSSDVACAAHKLDFIFFGYAAHDLVLRCAAQHLGFYDVSVGVSVGDREDGGRDEEDE